MDYYGLVKRMRWICVCQHGKISKTGGKPCIEQCIQDNPLCVKIRTYRWTWAHNYMYAYAWKSLKKWLTLSKELEMGWRNSLIGWHLGERLGVSLGFVFVLPIITNTNKYSITILKGFQLVSSTAMWPKRRKERDSQQRDQ